jgi:hypothetical protein
MRKKQIENKTRMQFNMTQVPKYNAFCNQCTNYSIITAGLTLSFLHSCCHIYCCVVGSQDSVNNSSFNMYLQGRPLSLHLLVEGNRGTHSTTSQHYWFVISIRFHNLHFTFPFLFSTLCPSSSDAHWLFKNVNRRRGEKCFHRQVFAPSDIARMKYYFTKVCALDRWVQCDREHRICMLVEEKHVDAELMERRRVVGRPHSRHHQTLKHWNIETTCQHKIKSSVTAARGDHEGEIVKFM